MWTVALSMTITMNACSQEALLPTHVTQLRIDPKKYADFVNELDVTMSAIGLARFGAAEGLNELKGRDVLYIEYRKHANDKVAFLTANDLTAVGAIDIRVYSSILPEHERIAALSRLESVLSGFDGKLVEQTKE
jgi:hypothetical protein